MSPLRPWGGVWGGGDPLGPTTPGRQEGRGVQKDPLPPHPVGSMAPTALKLYMKLFSRIEFSSF